jgi:outer membrane protein assembly factor BamE (lipoprotein component of BamABCDE complex)
MRKRSLLWAGLLLITLAGATVVFTRWATAFTPGVSYENLARLRYSMTQQQVEAVLGGPPNRTLPIAYPMKAGPPV